MGISGINHAASAPALLRFAFRVAIHAQGWLPAGWLAFTGRVSNRLDHYERFQITWSSTFPVLLTLDSCRARRMPATAESGHIRTARNGNRGSRESASSFGLDAQLLDERPPFLDHGLLHCAERFWRLLLARVNL